MQTLSRLDTRLSTANCFYVTKPGIKYFRATSNFQRTRIYTALFITWLDGLLVVWFIWTWAILISIGPFNTLILTQYSKSWRFYQIKQILNWLRFCSWYRSIIPLRVEMKNKNWFIYLYSSVRSNFHVQICSLFSLKLHLGLLFCFGMIILPVLVVVLVSVFSKVSIEEHIFYTEPIEIWT